MNEERFEITPVFSAAFSAAAAYYTAPFLGRLNPRFGSPVLFCMAIGVVLIAFVRVISYNDVSFKKAFFGGNEKLFFFFRKMKIYVYAAFFGFLIGCMSGTPAPVNTGLPPAGITGVYGVMLSDPRVLDSGFRARGLGDIALERTRDAAGTEAGADGTARVFFPEGAIPRMKEFGRGSEVFLEGFFVTSDFTEEQADGRSPVYEAAFIAEGVHITKAAPSLERFRTKVRLAVADTFAPYNWGGFALALLFGIKDNLDSELSSQYRDAGCSHILALSGMHLAVISGVIAFLLRKLLGFKAAAIAGAALICGYICLVGSMPSLDRAAIMYLIGTITALGFLPNKPLSALGMAFLLQIIIQPASGSSYSFILSYLALASILVLSAPVYDLFRGWLPTCIAASLSASIAAFLGTAAVSAAFFGVLKPFGIIASLVLVPLTTIFMLCSMAALALAFAAPSVLSVFGKALSLLYTVIEYAVSWAALSPGLAVSYPALALAVSAGLAVILFLIHNRAALARKLIRVPVPLF